MAIHGGRRNLVRVEAARMLSRMGAHRRYLRIDWTRVRRLVFVCKGNICRSPYAEFRARSLGLPAASAGLATTAGSPVDPGALREARLRGIDLAAARTTPVEHLVLRDGDLVLFLEPAQASAFRAHASSRSGIQQSLLGLWSRPWTPLIPDPYGHGERQFAACFDLIDSAVSTLARQLDRDAGRPSSATPGRHACHPFARR